MKCLVSLALIFLFSYVFTSKSLAQPVQITPKIAAKIQVRVDSAANAFKKKYLVRDGDNPEDQDFMLDTFKIERTAEYAIDYDYSTVGMNAIVDKSTDGYDALMNKYYKKLLAKLEGEDKQTLIKAQREWLKLKDLDIDLISTISQNKYSGGGSIQSNLNTSAIYDIVKQRALTMYHYYSRVN